MRRFFKIVMVAMLVVVSVMSFSAMMADDDDPTPVYVPVPVAEADLSVITAANAGQLKLLASFPINLFYGFSPDSSLLFYRAGDLSMHVWDIAAGATTLVIPVAAGPSVLSADRQMLYHLNQDSLEVWDINSGEMVSSATLEDAPETTFSLIISPDGKFVGFVDSTGGTIRFWDGSTGKSLFTIPVETNGGGSVMFTPDDSGALLYNSAGDMKLMNTADGSVVWTQHSDNINAGQLVFSPDGQMLAVVGVFGATDLVDMTSGTIAASIAGDRGNTSYSHGASFSQDGKTLVVLMDTGAARLFDLSGGIQTIVQTDTDYIAGYRALPMFSPDGTLVTLPIDAGVQVGDVAGSKPLVTLEVDRTKLTVRATVFSPNEKLLALFCADNTAGYGPTLLQLWGVAAS